MTNFNLGSPKPGGNAGGPPGQDMLGIALSGVAAVIGTPFLFNLIGPFVADIVAEAYGSDALADLMYFASFALSGIVIYAVSRMALYYAIGAIVAFAALRFGNSIPAAAF